MNRPTLIGVLLRTQEIIFFISNSRRFANTIRVRDYKMVIKENHVLLSTVILPKKAMGTIVVNIKKNTSKFLKRNNSYHILEYFLKNDHKSLSLNSQRIIKKITNIFLNIFLKPLVNFFNIWYFSD